MVLEEWEGKLIDGDTLDWVRLMDVCTNDLTCSAVKYF